MDIKEARKQVSTKPEPNYLMLQLDFEEHLVLPYKDGLMLLQALENAEVYRTRYARNSVGIHSLTTLDDDKLKTNVLSRERYIRIKMAHLLNVSEHDLKETEA